MRVDVATDWRWADGYLPAIHRILKANAFHLIDFEIADTNADLKQATDMIINIRGKMSIAVRLRRPKYDYRDLTIRAWREGNIETELQKIERGFADVYFYGWTNANMMIPEWMLIDVNRLRFSGLLAAYPITRNRDQRTGFIAIPHSALHEAGCVIASTVHGGVIAR